MMQLPKMYRLRQHFARPTVAEIATAVQQELAGLSLGDVIRPNQKIGITVGSRGIQNLLPMLKTCVDYLKDLEASPYLVAAMGSHGGGSEHGQREVLDSLGITETNLGAPVVTCAECHTIAHSSEGSEVGALAKRHHGGQSSQNPYVIQGPHGKRPR